VAAYAAAQIAAFTSFMPLLTLLAPLKAEEIAGPGKTALLSTALFWGAITAGFANLAAGVLSDHTRSPWGRRAPWIIAGSTGLAVAYGLILRAASPAELVAGLVIFQIFLNLMFAPLVAILPDQVPDAQKGSVSAFLALGPPIGTVLGAVLIGQIIDSPALRYAALAVVALTLAPLGFLLRERRSPPRAAPALQASQPAGAPGDYAWTWASRFLVQTAVSIASGYLLYFLSDAADYARARPGRSLEEGVAALMVVSTTANVAVSLAAGLLSDRVRRRKPFLIAAGAAMAAALTLMALVPRWETMLAAQALFGAAFGCYTAVDLALVAQVIPARRLAGRYLALMNFANTLPQVAAPMIAVALTSRFAQGYQILFAMAGVLALLGAAAVGPIRRVR
jgi:MFS family permease